MDNRRKSSSHTATVPGNNWSREIRPNSIRYANSSIYQQECAGEHVRFPGERTSEETFVEEEETANKNNAYNSPDESVFANVVPKHNHTTPREKYQRSNDHSEFNVPEAVIAMQKLQRLKELQMKRDINERYYSQEIKRLIGEYYFGPKMNSSTSAKRTGKLQSSSFQPYCEDRLKNNLKPCGTMTTITRLDCGCIQETTRPIFTTARGRVQRKNCSQSQDEVLLKLTSSNPQEHLFSSLEQRKDRYRAKPKKRLSMDPRICAKIPPAGDQEFETENEKRNEEQEQEIPDRISRTVSPRQKFSETSVTSV